jgi:tetratricopeptide (TPR) repeat protein
MSLAPLADSHRGAEKQYKSSVFLLPWAVLAQFFVMPPLALLSLFISPWFKWTTKVFTALVLLACLPAIPWLMDSLNSYQKLLWMRKFSQARKRFQYEEAQVFLDRIREDSPLEALELGLMKLDHSLSGGRQAERKLLLEQLLHLFEVEFSKLAASVRPSWDSWTFKDLLENLKNTGKISRGPRSAPWVFDSSTLSPQKKAQARRLFRVLCGGGSLAGGPTALMLYALKSLSDGPRLHRLILKAVWLEALLSEQAYLDSFGLDFYLLAYIVQHGDPALRSGLELSRGKSLEAELGEYVAQSPYHLKAYYFRGLLYLGQNKFKKAISDWLHIFKLDVYFFDIQARLMALLVLDNPQVSPETLGVIELYFEAESVRFLKGEFSRSLEISDNLLLIQNKMAERLEDEVLFNQGVMYRNNIKNYEKAIEVFDRLLTFKSTIRKEEALYNLVMCQLELGRYKDCEVRIFQLFENHPNSEHRSKLELLLFYVKAIQVLKVLGKGVKA